MALPALVLFPDPRDYRAHYKKTYCSGPLSTHDGIPVYFKPDAFDHAFYESTLRNGVKDAFSTIRAQRIDWIKATLEAPNANIYAGYEKSSATYTHSRRVAVVHEDFVVVIALRPKAGLSLKANFVTCYQADNSIGKIRQSPVWSLQECQRDLGISTSWK